MKNFVIIGLLILNLSKAQAFDGNTLKVTCQSPEGSILIMDQFQSDPCRIRQLRDGIEEVVTGISFCIFPDEVHDSFSFWSFVSKASTAELVGDLEPVGNQFIGSLSFNTVKGSELASLTCKAEDVVR